MNESAQHAIRQFAEELSDLRQTVGSPSLRMMASLAGGNLPRSTAADAVTGDRLPSLPVVFMFVDACREYANRNDIEVNDQDFDRVKWRKRWMAVKKLCRVTQSADNGDELAPAGLAALLGRLRQQADTGDEYAAKQLADLLIEQDDLKGLRQRADTGDKYAARRLADLLFERDDADGLRQWADAGDRYATERLADRWVERDDLESLRELAHGANDYAGMRLAEMLFKKLDKDAQRYWTDSGNEYSARSPAGFTNRLDTETLRDLINAIMGGR